MQRDSDNFNETPLDETHFATLSLSLSLDDAKDAGPPRRIDRILDRDSSLSRGTIINAPFNHYLIPSATGI